jgi:hypothetical protein
MAVEGKCIRNNLPKARRHCIILRGKHFLTRKILKPYFAVEILETVALLQAVL